MSDTATPTGRPFLLRRAWVAWLAVGLVLAAGVAGTALSLGERASAADELEQVREQVAAAEADAGRLREQSEDLEAANNGMLAGLRRCVQGLRDRVDPYNELSDMYNALEFLPEGEEAERLRARFAVLRDREGRVLGRCRNALAAEEA